MGDLARQHKVAAERAKRDFKVRQVMAQGHTHTVAQGIVAASKRAARRAAK